MEAKDTEMSDIDLIHHISEWVKSGGKDVADLAMVIRQDQAETSFKAGMKHGIWLFAWWKDGVQYVGTSGRTLAEAYKELGIE